jgi:hypothetical protein
MNDVLLVLLGAVVGGVAVLTALRHNASKHLAQVETDAFERGRVAGVAEEKQQLEVHVEPHQSITSEWLGLKKVQTVGYTHQLYYRGVPVGGPQLIVTSVEEKVDDDRMKGILAAAERLATVYVKQLAEKGIKAALQGATRGR